MKKIAYALLTLIIALVFVSCATEGEDPTGLRGVWKATDEDMSYKFTFTSDGHYAYEAYYEDNLDYAEFGTFETDGSYIYTDSYDHAISWDGDKLVLDFFGNELVLSRSSKTARNNTSQSKLYGVWKSDYGLEAFAKNGTFVESGSYPWLGTFTADSEHIYFDDDECDYLIINSTYYLRDEFGVHVFKRETSNGEDQTSRQILTNNNPWHLIDTGEGLNHYIYNFSEGGRYTREYYYDGSDERSKSSGTYKFSGHVIELSDDGELAYVIIDNHVFMFTI